MFPALRAFLAANPRMEISVRGTLRLTTEGPDADVVSVSVAPYRDPEEVIAEAEAPTLDGALAMVDALIASLEVA